MDTTTCPECGAPAEVTDRFALESTDGPIEHLRVQCVRGHWFLMSTASLAARIAAPAVPAQRPALRAPARALSRRAAPRPPRPARRSR
jgi:hypothetical protein